MREFPPLTEDDLIWPDDDAGPIKPKPTAETPAPEIEDESERIRQKEVSDAAARQAVEDADQDAEGKNTAEGKRKANVLLRKLDGKATAGDSSTWSEGEFARFWARVHALDEFLFVKGVGWVVFDSGIWRDGAGAAHRAMVALIKDRVEQTKAAPRFDRHSAIEGALKMAQVEPGESRTVEISSFDENAMAVGLPGGRIFDIAKGAARPATPEDRIRKALAFVPDTQDLNALIEGGPLEGNSMRQNSVTFDSQASVLIVGNHRPRASAASGIWRRLVQIEFRNRPEKPDPKLLDKLKAEAPGVLRWMVEGAARWHERGELPEVPAPIRQAVEAYRREAEPFARYLAERTAKAPGQIVGVNDLYADFKSWWLLEIDNDEKAVPKKRAFGTKLNEAGWPESDSVNGRRVRVGYALTDGHESEIHQFPYVLPKKQG